MTQEQANEVKKALAIYKGLNCEGRSERLALVRRAAHYTTDFNGHLWPDKTRTFARLALPHLEKAEQEMLEQERAESHRVRAEVVRAVRAEMSANTGRVRDGVGRDSSPVFEPRFVRAIVCVGAVGGLTVGVGAWIVASGLVPYVVGGLVLFALLRELPKGGGGEKKTDSSPPTASGNIHINITGHGGSINVSQGG